jgi:hypothetical protein
VLLVSRPFVQNSDGSNKSLFLIAEKPLGSTAEVRYSLVTKHCHSSRLLCFVVGIRVSCS